jgi:long-chain acyl-CoA synthetase
MATYATGAKIGFFTGDPLRLIEDCQILQPSFFPGVPRVLNRIYQAAMVAADVPGFKGDLFRKAYAAKLEKFRATGDNTHWFWDKLVFRKVGTKLEKPCLGFADLNNADSCCSWWKDTPYVKWLGAHQPRCCGFLEHRLLLLRQRRYATLAFHELFSLSLIFPGYGMTETCAVGNKTWKDDADSCGTVGPPQSSNEMKLVDVPAMGYTSEDIPNPRGELYVRGANCFSRYYKGQHLIECILVRRLTLSRREKHEGDHRRGRMGSHWGRSRDRLLWQVQDH